VVKASQARFSRAIGRDAAREYTSAMLSNLGQYELLCDDQSLWELLAIDGVCCSA
jgi:hypothetical protein